jgi:hypothetical protein
MNKNLDNKDEAQRWETKFKDCNYIVGVGEPNPKPWHDHVIYNFKIKKIVDYHGCSIFHLFLAKIQTNGVW